jgi:hypothetical protein
MIQCIKKNHLRKILNTKDMNLRDKEIEIEKTLLNFLNNELYSIFKNKKSLFSKFYGGQSQKFYLKFI